jgi:hypothetical protein
MEAGITGGCAVSIPPLLDEEDTIVFGALGLYKDIVRIPDSSDDTPCCVRFGGAGALGSKSSVDLGGRRS